MNDQNQHLDIAQFEAAETAKLDILGPNEEPLLYNGKPVVFTLCGPGSKEYVKAQAKLDSLNQARTFAALRGKPLKESADEQRKNTAEKLAACTKAIDNFPIGALDIYLNPKLGYITNQVVKFIEDWANFPIGSATN